MIKIQKSGNTEINLLISDDMRQLEGPLSVTDIISPIYILKRTVTPITIWWNTVMSPYWATPMTSLWNIHMDSEV